MGMMTGAYNGEDFSAFRPPLQYNEEAGLVSARPGAQRLAVTSGGTIPDRGTYTVVLPEEGSGPGPRKVGELDAEMVYESRLETSSPSAHRPGRSRKSPGPCGGGSCSRTYRPTAVLAWRRRRAGRGIRTVPRPIRTRYGARTTRGSLGRHHGSRTSRFDTTTIARLRRDGLDDNAIGNVADLLAEQRAATGTIPQRP